MYWFDGKHKLADKWEQEPYTVIAQPNEDIPVFTVRKENGEGRIRTLHRNLLLPVGFLNDSPPTPAPRKTRTKPVTRTVCEEPKNTQHEDSRESDSEDDSVWGIVVSHEEQEASSPVTADETFIAQETTGENQDSSARDTEVEIAQEEIPEAAASPTETEQIPVTSVPLRRSTRQRKLPFRYQTGDFLSSKSAIQKEDWEKKISYITSLCTNSDLFSNLQEKAGILELLSSK